MKKNSTLQLLVRSALLLAIAVLFQNLRIMIPVMETLGVGSTLIIGSLVNLALYVAAGTVGWRGSVLIGTLTPVVASLQGHLATPLLIPFVAAGNIVMVLGFEMIERGSNKQSRMWTGVGVSAVIKTVVLYVLIALVFVKFLLPGLGYADEKVKVMTAALTLNFSWPQLVTALIGGAVAIPVLQGLRRALKMQKND